MRKIILIVIFVIIPFTAFAQMDVNVYNEVIYSYLDKLASAKLVKTYSPNQRPLSRYSVAKLVVEARDRYNSEDKDGLDVILTDLESEFAHEIDLIRNEKGETFYIRPIDTAGISWTAANQPEEAMPVNNLGTASGNVQPLLAYKNGQRYEKYANIYIDTSHWLNATPYFSFYIQPLFYSRSGGIENGGINLYRGYIKAGYKNFELQVGRDDIHWGPGKYSLFFSGNARGEDMIRLTTPSTFRLPWFLKHLGQWRFTTFFSWLNKDYHPNNAILSGYRIDYQPLYWLDIGFDHAVFMGGKGARNPDIKTAIGEYIGFIFDSGNSRASSNHLMGFDMTFQIPPLLGMELYGKILLEDTQQEYLYMLKNNASWLGGVYFPRLAGKDKLSLRGEFVHTCEFAYRHGFYEDGFALDDKFIGYDAGSDTYSGILEAVYQFNLNEFMGAGARYLMRSSNTYAAHYSSTGNNDGLDLVTRGIDEYHFIFKISGQKKLNKVINIYGEAGIDGTKNKGFISGYNDLDFATQIKFVFHDLTN